MRRGFSRTALLRGQLELDASNDRYLSPALALLPPGYAFDAPEQSILRKTVDALSRQQSRVGRKQEAIQAQLLPGATGELLREWEDIAGLSGDEELAGWLEWRAIWDEYVSFTGRKPPQPTHLDELRAAAISRLLNNPEPFSFEELERRARETVIKTRLGPGPIGRPSLQRIAFSGIEVEQQTPFRAGISRAGDAVYSHEWLGRFDITLVTIYNPGEPLAPLVKERARLLFIWLIRVWPQWCALALYVRTYSSDVREPILYINCTN